MSEGVFAALRALDAAARAHATRCAAAHVVETAPPDRRLVVIAAGRRVRIGLGDVREVRRSAPLARLPGTQPWLLGMGAHDGRAVAVIDLATLLFDAAPHAHEQHTGSLLLCGDGATLTALRVDAIEVGGDADPTTTTGDASAEPVDLDLSVLLANPTLREPGRWPRATRRPPPRPEEDAHAD